MLSDTLKTLRPGAHLWVYRADYGKIDTGLGRVVDQNDLGTRLAVVFVPSVSYGDVTTEEMTLHGKEDKFRFAACSEFDAQRWLVDHAVGPKLKKQIAEREAHYRSPLGGPTSSPQSQTLPLARLPKSKKHPAWTRRRFLFDRRTASTAKSLVGSPPRLAVIQSVRKRRGNT